MALISCYECGKEISSAAPACPQCGAPKEHVAVATPAPLRVPEAASATRPATTGFPDTVREELVNSTEVGKWAIIAWVIYGFFLPSAVPTAHNPFGVLVGFVCGIVSFRGWFSRRTAKVILNRQSLDGFALNIYLPALWSYAWRSSVVFIPLAFFLGSLGGGAEAMGMIAGMWVFPSLFIFDVPFWVRRRLRRCSWPENPKNPANRSNPTGSMINTTLVASAVFLLGLVGLRSAPENVFVGIPTVRGVADGKEAKLIELTAKDKEEYVCRIVSDNGRFLWASRENKELTSLVSGAFTFYMAKDGSGMIKVVKDRGLALSAFDYFEQLSMGLSTFTYWGEKAPMSQVELLQRKFQESELARQEPELLRLIEATKPELIAVEKASGDLLSAYNELGQSAAQNGLQGGRTLEQIRKLNTTSDALTEVMTKYERYFDSAIPTLKFKLNEDQLNGMKTGVAALKLLAAAGKRVAERAALYAVSQSEEDRTKFIYEGTDFENQWEVLLKRGKENSLKLESLLEPQNKKP